MQGSVASIFSRNLGILSPAEQHRLLHARVAVVGLGSVGGMLAERLIRLGIGHLKIADPGIVEENHLNRQLGTSTANLGRKKVEVLFAHVKDINPQAKIEVSGAGITGEDDAALFADGCDLVIDQRDVGLFREAILLQRAARRRGAYYMFAVAMGFGALVAVFDPRGCTLEEYNGLYSDVDLADPEQLRVPWDRIAPIAPSYATAALTDEQVQLMLSGQMPGPCISIGAGLAAVLAATEAINVILQRRAVPAAPLYTYVDLLDQQFVVGCQPHPSLSARPEQF